MASSLITEGGTELWIKTNEITQVAPIQRDRFGAMKAQPRLLNSSWNGARWEWGSVSHGRKEERFQISRSNGKLIGSLGEVRIWKSCINCLKRNERTNQLRGESMLGTKWPTLCISAHAAATAAGVGVLEPSNGPGPGCYGARLQYQERYAVKGKKTRAFSKVLLVLRCGEYATL